jgi:hypothetical protein
MGEIGGAAARSRPASPLARARPQVKERTVSNIVQLSGRTHLAHLTGHSPIDLDAERLRRAQHVRDGRLARRQPVTRAARRGATVSEGVRYPAFGRDGPDAA